MTAGSAELDHDDDVSAYSAQSMRASREHKDVLLAQVR